jgi:2-polyprenyl-3-methyl-5-hydroxy-6-metoxy-1,4-benzoquinol methylase
MLLCKAALEHVGDVEQAFAAFASILKPQGLALIWVPSRHAAFARLNMALPEKMKRNILFCFSAHAGETWIYTLLQSRHAAPLPATFSEDMVSRSKSNDCNTAMNTFTSSYGVPRSQEPASGRNLSMALRKF